MLVVKKPSVDGISPVWISLALVASVRWRFWRKKKDAPGSGSRWKYVSARFTALYKALLAEPDAATRSNMLRIAMRASG